MWDGNSRDTLLRCDSPNPRFHLAPRPTFRRHMLLRLQTFPDSGAQTAVKSTNVADPVGPSHHAVSGAEFRSRSPPVRSEAVNRSLLTSDLRIAGTALVLQKIWAASQTGPSPLLHSLTD